MDKKEKNTQKNQQRRDFLKKGAYTLGAFTILPSHALFSKPAIRNKEGELIKAAVVAPSDKVNMAFCGTHL